MLFLNEVILHSKFAFQNSAHFQKNYKNRLRVVVPEVQKISKTSFRKKSFPSLTLVLNARCEVQNRKNFHVLINIIDLIYLRVIYLLIAAEKKRHHTKTKTDKKNKKKAIDETKNPNPITCRWNRHLYPRQTT